MLCYELRVDPDRGAAAVKQKKRMTKLSVDDMREHFKEMRVVSQSVSSEKKDDI